MAQIFGNKMPVKSRVIMEQKILDTLTSGNPEPQRLQPVDNLVVKSFTENFNKEYASLLPEQKTLLNRYISSFNENEADFKLYVGSELKRIKESVEASLGLPEVQDDQEMIDNTRRVIEQVSGFNVSNLNEKQILKILKLQKLVREYEENANND